jgi:hypothetical protein
MRHQIKVKVVAASVVRGIFVHVGFIGCDAVGTNVSGEYTASLFSPENVGIMFFRNVW